jgi:Fe-S-cluster containining protein
MSTSGEAARNVDGDLQRRVAGQGDLETFVRNMASVEVDLDDEEVELTAVLPDQSFQHARGNLQLTRKLELARHPAVREAVKSLVAACTEALQQADPAYDPRRCDRCVKADCCWYERIHVTLDERRRILAHLGLADTPENNAGFFQPDDDLGGYYRSVLGRVNGHCVFLKQQGSLMRCSIYSVRPQVCVDFDAGYCDEYTELLPAAPFAV